MRRIASWYVAGVTALAAWGATLVILLDLSERVLP